MNFFISICTILLLSFQSIDLDTLRMNYKNAATDEKASMALSKQLQGVTKKDKLIFIAYKGASITLKGKYSKKIKEKISYFKEGIVWVEYAISKAPEDIEIRLIRLSIQENTPRILKYKKNIQEDKQVIIENYNSISSSKLKEYVKLFVLQSKSFTTIEKDNLFK